MPEKIKMKQAGHILKMVTASMMMAAAAIKVQAQPPVPIDTITANGIEKTWTLIEKNIINADTTITDQIVTTDITTPKAEKKAEKKKNKGISPVIRAEITDSSAVVKLPRDWSSWSPQPQKALWMALVIPGGGQIYNRKYWKLPIIYGGFMGCLYAMSWNNTMYKDYSQAYLDIMDTDPNTQSYNKFLHLGNTINDQNIERYKQIFKSRKDKYRRWRDMSFFCLIGVYALSVIDAYVDAELSEFDISKDLSMKIRPTIMQNKNTFTAAGPFDGSSVGLQCCLNF